MSETTLVKLGAKLERVRAALLEVRARMRAALLEVRAWVRAALLEVRAHHQPERASEQQWVCARCGTADGPWPCSTVATIREVLGDE